MSDASALAPLLQPGLLALAAVLLGIASLNDIAVRTIPNLASFGLVVIGVAAPPRATATRSPRSLLPWRSSCSVRCAGGSAGSVAAT